MIVTLVEDFDEESESFSESLFEIELPVNTPFQYVVRFACEQFGLDHEIKKKGETKYQI